MTDRVLTDQEIDEAYTGGYPPSLGYIHIERLRMVEAAVLAKCVKITRPDGSTIRTIFGVNVVTEREARRRERAAWDGAANYVCSTYSMGTFRAHGPERDRRYPLPTVSRPRTVTLSDGVRVARGMSDWMRWGTIPVHVPDHGLFALAKTPADARALADLVEHPLESVPDDA